MLEGFLISAKVERGTGRNHICRKSAIKGGLGVGRLPGEAGALPWIGAGIWGFR